MSLRDVRHGGRLTCTACCQVDKLTKAQPLLPAPAPSLAPHEEEEKEKEEEEEGEGEVNFQRPLSMSNWPANWCCFWL